VEQRILESELTNVVRRIWRNMLERSVSRVSDASDVFVDQETLTVQVDIHGGWHGSVILQTNHDLVNSIATRMYHLENGSRASSEQMEESLKEIGNIVAGNVKCVLPEPCILSIPIVVSDETPAPEPSNQSSAYSKVVDVVFSDNLGLMLVQIFKHNVHQGSSVSL